MTKFSTEANLAAGENAIVVDSNVLIAAHVAKDTLYTVAKTSLLKSQSRQKCLNVLLLSEVATVLLQKTKKIDFVSSLIRQYLRNTVPTFHLTPLSVKLLNQTLEVFSSQKKPVLSFADCSLVAQANLQGIRTILTFDRDLRRIFKGEFTFLPRAVG